MSDESESAFADGELVPVTRESGGRGEQLAKFIADFNCSEAHALEVLEWVEENCAAPAPVPQARNAARVQERFYDIMAALISAPPARAYWRVRQVLWRLNQTIFDDLINHETPADWYRPMGVSKEMSYREANETGDALGLPRRDDQRKPEARAKMRDRRYAARN